MSREPIDFNSDTTLNVLLKLAEGNPGAISVLKQMLSSPDPMSSMLFVVLEDMNMRGSQIWVGYKDHCGENLEKFMQCLKDNDPKMIATVNLNSGVDEQAVTSGNCFSQIRRNK